MEQVVLLEDGESAEVVEARRAAKRAQQEAAQDQAAPRLVEPNRKQIELRPQDLESLLPPCHRARAIWAVVERLDLSRFLRTDQGPGESGGPGGDGPKSAGGVVAVCHQEKVEGRSAELAESSQRGDSMSTTKPS